MSVSHTLTFGHAGGSVSLTDSVTVSGSTAAEVSETVAGTTTNQLVTIAYLTAGVVGVYIKSDQALTIKTNSSGSPDETIAIAAGVPYTWCTGRPDTLLLAHDCTKWYVTNAGSTTANLYVRILN